MESSADRDDLRFRLDWPEGEGPEGLEDELADFSFDWEQRDAAGADADLATADLALSPAEPEQIDPSEVDVAAGAVASAELPVDEMADVPFEPPRFEPRFEATEAFAPPPTLHRGQELAARALDLVAQGDSSERISFGQAPTADEGTTYDYGDDAPTAGEAYSIRRALDDNNEALRTLSEAVYELASNVQLLVDEVEGIGGSKPGAAGDVTATAMVTLSTELTVALDKMSDNLNETRNDLAAVMDDMVAAADAPQADTAIVARLSVDVERVHAELRSLKRRLPVRAHELDPQDIAERVADLVMTRLSPGWAAAAPIREEDFAPAPAPAPARAEPKRRVARKQRPIAAAPEEAPAPAKAPAKAKAKRSRPLRAD